jgi:hypothetical protein
VLHIVYRDLRNLRGHANARRGGGFPFPFVPQQDGLLSIMTRGGTPIQLGAAREHRSMMSCILGVDRSREASYEELDRLESGRGVSRRLVIANPRRIRSLRSVFIWARLAAKARAAPEYR